MRHLSQAPFLTPCLQPCLDPSRLIPFLSPHFLLPQRNQAFVFFMSTRQTTFSTSNIQLITDASADFIRLTGKDLSMDSFGTQFEHSNSPEAILELLQSRKDELERYQDGNQRLIGCLGPIVRVLHGVLGVLREVVKVPISLAHNMFIGIDILLAAASGVTSSYNDLINLFECLENLLKRLEIYTMVPPTPIMTDIIIKIMVQLLSVFAIATKQIQQGRFKKFPKKLLKEGEIENVLRRLDRLTQDEARMTVVPFLGVVYGLVRNLKAVMEGGKISIDTIQDDLVAINQVINETNKPRRDQLRWDVRHWLSPPDPSMNHNVFRKAQHSGTAAWFFEGSTFAEWKTKRSPSLLWVHGKPGAGKSTLISSIIQDVKRMNEAGLATVAYYYFDFRDVKKQDCFGFLSSLISQLAAESDSCYNVLSKLYSNNTHGLRKPDVETLKECVTDMLSLPGHAPIYIIVDGLDECPNFPRNQSARGEVLRLIEDLVNPELPNLHLCVASRPEIDVRIVLEPLTSLQLSLHDESGQKEDIIAYIKSVVRSDRRMRGWRKEDQNLVIDTLCQKADGMFRWAVCQLDNLRRGFAASIRSILADLPENLYETYARSLLGIDEEKRECARRLFKCLLASIRPLRIDELGDIFAVQFDETAPVSFNEDLRPLDAEKAVLSVCSSLIAIDNREGIKIVQFSHFSVKEFLISQQLATAEEHLSYYHILPNHAHTTFAHACLAVLLQLDDKIDKISIGRFPLASYAARHWVDHARFGNVSPHIQGAMERLFDPARPYFSAWVWLYDVDHHWIEPMCKIRPTRPEATPLYYAALCGFRDLAEHLIDAHSPYVNSRGGSRTTALHAAVDNGDSEVASLLLRNGADPNSRDHLGRAPLHRTSRQGQTIASKSSYEIAQLLIKYGANVNVTDDQGGTPLHAAVRCGNLDITQLLLESRASLDVRDKNQRTPLHVACANGRLDVSRLLINRGSDINSRDTKRFIPLHMASRFGHADIARLLLECGSDVDVRESQHWTPLHYASRNGFVDLARVLIDHGADVDAQEAVGWTGLHIASATGDLKFAELLIDHGANVDSLNDEQKTPLDLASGNAKLEVAGYLIRRGATVSSRDDRGWTSFHTASYYGHLDVAKFFLVDHKIHVDIRTGNGETSLYLASSNGKLDVVRFLINQGANIHIKDKNRWNPVHIASDNGHLDIVRQLVNDGTPVDILNGTQNTPLALASRKGNVEVGRFLVERGADVNARDKESRAPLHFATKYGHLEMTRLLLDQGVDVNVPKHNSWGPIHFASTHGHLKVVELLVHRGAGLNVLTGMQETPLHLAAGSGEVEIARLLIDHGANLHTANSNGWTPLHGASRRGHLEVVKLLLCRGADVDVLNKARKTAAELASENGHAEVANLVVAYKSNANIWNKIRSSTLDTVQYCASNVAKDKVKSRTSLHSSAEEGNIDVLLSLLNWGADVNGRNASKQTPLDRAARCGNVSVIRLLIARGADADSRDTWGWTPLHCASRYGHLEVSRLLIDNGANVNATKHDYWSPLHLSANNGHLGTVKLLLKHGADVHATNDQGETPYEASLRRGYPQIADLLREHTRADQGSNSHSGQSANGPYAPHLPAYVFYQQNLQPMTVASPHQSPAGVHGTSGPYPADHTRMSEKRKALIIGTNFTRHPDSPLKLKRCIEDAHDMSDFLRAHLRFAASDIRIMTDETETPSWNHPTKENILEAMRELVFNAQPGDSFFFYFSGHGVQINDLDGDEPDERNECICAVDFLGSPYLNANTPGLIADDIMHEILVKSLPQQCHLTAIFDSCHSGTVLDLPHIYRSDGVVKKLRHPYRLEVLREKKSKAIVISLSASNDNQKSRETYSGGALRRAFIDSMRMSNNSLTHWELIQRVREYMMRNKFRQRPQLSSSHEIDTNLRFVV